MSKPDYRSAAEYAKARADADELYEAITANDDLRDLIVVEEKRPELVYEPCEEAP